MQKKNVAVIGAGHLGKFHAEKYSQMKNVNLIAVVDMDKKTATAIANANNTKPYTDYREIIEKVDAVSISVPTSYHYDIAKEFIRAGKDVLVEKPITVTVKEADELVRLAKKNGVVFQVGHIERFNPSFVAAKRVIKDPKFIESHRLSFFKGRGGDVSVILDLMIHDIDIILSVVDSKIKRVSASGVPILTKNIDIANARIEFENGCVANITASRASKEELRKMRFFQHDKYISVDFKKQIVNVLKKTDKVENGIPVIEEQPLEVEKKDALYEELSNFINCTFDRKAPLVSGKAGRDALDVATKVINHIKKTLHS